MERILQGNARMTGRITPISFSRGLGWGLIGGLAGTLVMDLVLMGALSALGSPALTCFSIVGNTVARFFSIQGVEMARAIQIGLATHYLDRAAGRSNLWDGRCTGRSSAGEYSEKEHPPGDSFTLRS